MLFLPGPSLEVCTSHSLTPSDLHKYVLHKDFPGHFLKIAVSSPHSSLAPPPPPPPGLPLFLLCSLHSTFYLPIHCIFHLSIVCLSRVYIRQEGSFLFTESPLPKHIIGAQEIFIKRKKVPEKHKKIPDGWWTALGLPWSKPALGLWRERKVEPTLLNHLPVGQPRAKPTHGPSPQNGISES